MGIPILDQAEAHASQLARKGNDYIHLTPGDKGVALVLLERIQKLERRMQSVESGQDPE